MSVLPAVAMLIVAAGRGSRIGGDVPKQYLDLAGRSVLAHTLAAADRDCVNTILVLIHPDDESAFERALAQSGVAAGRVSHAHGGASRQESVRLGLEALAAKGMPADGIVLIHDAARPFLSEVVILRAILALQAHAAALPVVPVVDTLALLDGRGTLSANPDRNDFRLVQTPQSFRFGLILSAHQRAKAEMRSDFTDDAGLARAYGTEIGNFPGDPDLFKITLDTDLIRAKAHLAQASETRTGLGYDVHAFTAGDHVMLGGVRVPHEQALSGHSDADPLLHAITDALLGTIGDGDIGQHFPPSDPQWRGAASRIFLEDAARRVRAKGGRIINVDATIVCEAPKVGPHRVAMQACIGEILGLLVERVGVKATTSEKLGFTGRKEGIAAMASVSVAFHR